MTTEFVHPFRVLAITAIAAGTVVAGVMGYLNEQRIMIRDDKIQASEVKLMSVEKELASITANRDELQRESDSLRQGLSSSGILAGTPLDSRSFKVRDGTLPSCDGSPLRQELALRRSSTNTRVAADGLSIAAIPQDPSRRGSQESGYEAYINDGRLIRLIAPLVEVGKKYPEVGVSWTISLDEDVQAYLSRINADGGTIDDSVLRL
jgi:hypothetical protein